MNSKNFHRKCAVTLFKFCAVTHLFLRTDFENQFAPCVELRWRVPYIGGYICAGYTVPGKAALPCRWIGRQLFSRIQILQTAWIAATGGDALRHLPK